jgi:hypothetical protein
MKKSIGNIVAVFLLLSFLFVPLTFNGKDWQFGLTQFLFEKPIAWLQKAFFPNALSNIDFSSDTIALNLLLLLLLILAVMVTRCLIFFRIKTKKIIEVTRTISCYYIAFILLKYGFDKVFKAQFYLPEPNILYTPFGQLTKDTLYWSTLGTSRFYSVATGLVEVIAAALIVLKRTRILGLMLALGIFINIVFINFGFDISVKTFSLFLVFTNLCAVFPFIRTLVNFFVFGKQNVPKPIPSIIENKTLNVGLKTMLIGLILIEILYPYAASKNFNDDLQKRPFLHGGYRVTNIYPQTDALPAKDLGLKNIFIHRNHYLIFQDVNDRMTDYHFEVNELKKQLILEDYQKNKMIVEYEFNPKDSIFKLILKKNVVVSKMMNWQDLPALKDKTHYTVDEIK